MTVYLHTVPVAARRVLNEACKRGLTARDWKGEARRLEGAAAIAGAPRWVRRPVGLADDARGAAVGRFSLGLWLRGWAEDDHADMKAAELAPGVPLVRVPATPWELLAFHTNHLPRKPTGKRPCWRCPADAPSSGCEVCHGSGVTRRRAPTAPEAWWQQRTAARGKCKANTGLFARLDHGADPLIAKALGCGERSCPVCSRLAQRRAVSRYTPAIAAPLRPGWDREFFTVGSTEPIRTPDDLAAWRARLAQLQRGMVEGRPEFGIPAGAWEAGITVVETLPRDGGDALFAHAHLLLVRRKWYPYGWSLDRIGQAFDLLRIPRAQRWTPLGRPKRKALERILDKATGLRALVDAGVPGALEVWRGPKGTTRPPRTVAELLGCRGLQRHLGDLVELREEGGVATGEVGSHDVVRIERDRDGVEIIGRYLSKIMAYQAKVERDGTSAFWDSAQAQWILKGVRRCQPWGGFFGLHAGPTRRGWEAYPGATDPRALVGAVPTVVQGPVGPDGPEEGPYAPTSLPEGVTTEEPCSRWEVHTLSRERIATWRWCHKPRFWKWLHAKHRPHVARRPRRPWRTLGLPVGWRPSPEDPRERTAGGWDGVVPDAIDVDAPPLPPRPAQVGLFGPAPPS